LDYGDPDFLYRAIFYPKGQIAFFHGRGYNNPQVAEWLEQATQVSDFNKRKELYFKVVKTINEEFPAVFTTRGNAAVGIRSNVKGYKAHAAGLDRYAGGGLHYTWLEK
jgi:ABC-type transport system substrate-binding protein